MVLFLPSLHSRGVAGGRAPDPSYHSAALLPLLGDHAPVGVDLQYFPLEAAVPPGGRAYVPPHMQCMVSKPVQGGHRVGLTGGGTEMGG